MAILVTGGAGYIGSHVVRQLSEAGEAPVVLDNLSTGFKDALIHGEKLVVGDVGDSKVLDQVFSQNKIEAVMHFAASMVVPESVSNPLKYFKNNSVNTLTLIESCIRHGVKIFIFSSTAAVYGMPQNGEASEDTFTKPINPYGNSKLMSEVMLRDIGEVGGLRHAVLRYFNAAGADPKARMGQRTPQATHLIKVCCEAAVGKRDGIDIFGNQYSTPDGTCLRDYIHVEDLSSAHILALKYLREGGDSVTLNVGYGKASSVLEVVKAVEEAAGHKLKTRMAGPRPGDPPILIAKSDKIRSLFGWKPQYDKLEKIVKDAYVWERKLSGK